MIEIKAVMEAAGCRDAHAQNRKGSSTPGCRLGFAYWWRLASWR